MTLYLDLTRSQARRSMAPACEWHHMTPDLQGGEMTAFTPPPSGHASPTTSPSLPTSPRPAPTATSQRPPTRRLGGVCGVTASQECPPHGFLPPADRLNPDRNSSTTSWNCRDLGLGEMSG